LGSVAIYDKYPTDNKGNYIVLDDGYIVINNYKTAKHHGKYEELLPIVLINDIRNSIKAYPRDYLFIKEDGLPMCNNTYSAFVKSTFMDLFGRATSLSLLRHIYITEKLDFNKLTIEELEEEAKGMLHTPELQRKYKWCL
jgi:hypothetical protein